MSKRQRDLSRAEKAAAIRAAQVKKERTRKAGLVVGIVAVLSVIVAAGTWLGGGTSSPTDNSSVEVTAGAGSVIVGDASAPVKVVIYEDFLCPYCRQLESSTRDFLRENAAKGKVQVEYRPIHLLRDFSYSARALNAWAAVLNNASPQAALELHDLLFEKQPYEQSSEATTDADIAALVDEVGAGTPEVTAALKVMDQGFFAAADQVMESEGIDSTPTVAINGKILSGLSVVQLRGQIENAVSNAS